MEMELSDEDGFSNDDSVDSFYSIDLNKNDVEEYDNSMEIDEESLAKEDFESLNADIYPITNITAIPATERIPSSKPLTLSRNSQYLQKSLLMKTEEDLQFEESQLKFLNHDNIMSTVLCNCCPKNCLVSIFPGSVNENYSEAYELIKACRMELMGLNEEQRMDEIRNIINGL